MADFDESLFPGIMTCEDATHWTDDELGGYIKALVNSGADPVIVHKEENGKKTVCSWET